MRKRNNKLSEDAILDIFREKHGSKYKYPLFPEQFTVKSHISIICSIHGEFTQTIEHHLQGHGCQKCAQVKIQEGNRLGRSEWIRRFESVHGRGTYDYSKVPEDVKQNSEIEIFCPEHNISFRQTVNAHWHLQRRCPKCGHLKQWENRRQQLITRREFEQRAKAVHGLAFEYSELPPIFSLNDSIIIYCNEHNHVFFCKAQDHLNGKGCSELVGITKS